MAIAIISTGTVSYTHLDVYKRQCKDNVILANSGHFDVEIDLNYLKSNCKSKRKVRPFVEEYLMEDGRKIYVLAEGRLVNLSAAEGHPASVMDMSFANQALSAKYIFTSNEKQMCIRDSYVISTGETHSVKEWVELSFKCLDLDWEKYVGIDERYIRPVDVDLLVGDSSKARKILGWAPKVKFEELIKIMVEYDYNNLKKRIQ